MQPLRKVKTASPEAPLVSLCVVTFMTSHPWHKERMEVVKMCISSMLSGAGHDCELIIWDNGSTVPKFLDMLQFFNPFTFVRSANIGGYNARRAMAGMARGKYTCLTDDDILFSPDWLRKQMEIVTNWEQVVANGAPRSCKRSYTDIAKHEYTEVKVGRFIPQQWRDDQDISVGVHEIHGSDVMVTKGSVSGLVTRVDMQMLGDTKFLREMHEPYNKLLGTSGGLCDRIEANHWTQISTMKRTAVHIGNVIDPSIDRIRKEMEK